MSADTRQEAIGILKKHNPNDVLTNTADWLKGLHGADKRFVPYNGAMSTEQVAFIETTLVEAARNHVRSWRMDFEFTPLQEKVIVLSHLPLAEGAASINCLA